jgi:hypothetical protein
LNDGFKKFLSESEKDRVDTFPAGSQRLGANVQYIEKDFWVCWTLDALYHGLPPGDPRLLFKGELEALSGKKRNAKLDAIRDACQVWVKGLAAYLLVI